MIEVLAIVGQQYPASYPASTREVGGWDIYQLEGG